LVEKIEQTGTYEPGCCADMEIVKKAIDWAQSMLDTEKRKKLVTHNYQKAYDYLSHDATLPRLVKSINYIYHRHGHPGREVKASTLNKLTHLGR
jgi:hypothetical protein